MEYRIKLTGPAEADLNDAYAYLRELSESVANAWFKNISASILSLKQMPTRCALIDEAEEIGLPIRHHLFGKRTATYRIIFDIQSSELDAPTVRILRIWHASHDRLDLQDLRGLDV